ncbi:MAG: glycoside hydrolase family 30 beta sandwich domain-containing protein [Aristaeellaceae bacterium]
MKQTTTLFTGGRKRVSGRTLAWDERETGREKDLINLYPDVQYQTLRGFGGAFTDAAGYVYAQMPREKQLDMIRACYSPEGLGYTLGRASVDSCGFSAEQYDSLPEGAALSGMDVSRAGRYVLPMLADAQQAAGRPIAMMLTPWSPPAWIKTNGSRVGGGALKEEYAPLWAEYICRCIRAYQAQGADVRLLSVQNEPRAVQRWDSCIFTAAQEREFIRRHLGPALRRHGLDGICLLIWDHNRERVWERAVETIADDEMERLVGGVAMHGYAGDHFEALQMLRDRFPDKELILSEACVEYSVHGGGHQLRNAQMYAHDIIGCLNHGMNAFLAWNLLLDGRGGSNHAGNYCDAPIMYDAATGELRRNLSYEYIGHFTRYLKPGARRIGISRFDERVEVTAFRNPDGGIAAVLLNRRKEDAACFLRMGGRVCPVTLPAGSISTVELGQA